MDLLLVLLFETLCPSESHHILLLVEMFHLELSAKLQDLFGLALSLWKFRHLMMESFVQVLEILFLFSLCHEK